MYVTSNLVYISLIFLNVNADILVNIPNGTILGRQEYSQRGITFYAFQQIPYAKPPIGNLRFQSPQPAERWEGILNATVNTKVCVIQGYIQEPTLVESEDCLYLNIYTPRYPSQELSLPVIVYFHGGGFVVGDGTFNTKGPHYFMEHDVILVTLNYRIGLLGFLSTEDAVIPGNYGLKDQQHALKWVQENIKYFGGDPTKVTIFGQSAGAAAVTYQLMSQKSKGLFRGAIALSGSILCPWGYQRNARKYAYQMARYLNSSFNEYTNSEAIRELFLSVTFDQLKMASFQIEATEDQMIGGYLFSPVIEPEHEDAFITEYQYGAIENGHMSRVPLIIGICSEERLWDIGSNLTVCKEKGEMYDNNITRFVHDDMHITDQNVREVVGEAIRKVYVDGLIQDNPGKTIKYFSDNSFGRGIIQHAKLQSQFSDVYFYEFSYYGRELAGWRPYVEGADRINHADDLAYLFVTKNNSNLDTMPPADILSSVRYRTLLTNFAKTLNPTSEHQDILGISEWPTVNPDNFLYLNFNNTLTIQKDLKQDVHPALVTIYEKYAIKPLDTF
ncbi:juvenile hormone esterase-like isoform X1 [Diorhabda sublineata]|uniref:juvenile hormone esterase-like isoform X1 n=1 Tax=Diorhabda sublineata TaxID=1163346 RepID=UPI0024E10448|nr:juvenile hormone esterase-like isoform X1 [Diorhabda sublineata]